MTFVDICYFTLYLIFIVWLWFVNHLLNYYLLTYLLTYLLVENRFFGGHSPRDLDKIHHLSVSRRNECRRKLGIKLIESQTQWTTVPLLVDSLSQGDEHPPTYVPLKIRHRLPFSLCSVKCLLRLRHVFNLPSIIFFSCDFSPY